MPDPSRESTEQARSVVNRLGLATQTDYDDAVGQIAVALDAAWAAGFRDGELSARLKTAGLMNPWPEERE